MAASSESIVREIKITESVLVIILSKFLVPGCHAAMQSSRIKTYIYREVTLTSGPGQTSNEKGNMLGNGERHSKHLMFPCTYSANLKSRCEFAS